MPTANLQSQTLILGIQIDPDLVPAADEPSLMIALSDFSPYLEEAEEEVQEADQEGFDTEGSSFGNPWPGLSLKTEAEKRRHGFSSQPEVRSQALKNAIGQTVLLSADSLTVGIDTTAVPYAAVQNAGNSKRHLPARVLIAISQQEIQILEDLLREYIEQVVGHPVPGFSLTAQLQ